MISTSPSISKKGYGNLCSLDEKKQYNLEMNKGPGPGQYSQNNSTISTQVSLPGINDKNNSSIMSGKSQINPMSKLQHSANYNSHGKYLNQLSSQFKHEVERKLGPGSYNPDLIEPNTNIGHNLKSQQERIFDYTSKMPGPGQYDLNRAI